VAVRALGLAALDTAGALVLYRLTQALERVGAEVAQLELSPPHARLLDLVRARIGPPVAPAPGEPGWLARLGRGSWDHLVEGWELLAFIGEIALALGRTLMAPGRVRWRALLATLETAGVDAVPIVALLAFLIGVVIAYQGGVQLRFYGANVYVVELVTVTVVRELAPMMTAIIAAGRTGSAFTAQIGTMKVTEEVDALRTIGIDPIELLVLPKVFGLAVALPLLTVLADAMGVVGGMVMAAAMLDVRPGEFLDRVPQAVSLTSVLTGIVKAPVFAAIIAVVGCFQGLRVSGGADSVGRQTTVSVVQAIFLIIVVDAAFSVLFSWLGI
jgi:phospholipid/cholesterol/gamma-HCH transport system permease protein